MKYVLGILLLGFCFGFGAIQEPLAPEKIVQGFVYALNKKDLDGAAKFINGGSVGAFLKDRPSTFQFPTLTLSSLTATISGDFALVTFRLKSEGPGAMPESSEHLVLIRSDGKWLIDVPAARGGLEFMAFVLSNPPMFQQAHTAAQGTLCLSNVKQVALGLIMFETDHDDALKLTAANWKTSIMPYVKNEAIFKCPLDPPGTMSYSINAKLVGKSAEAINSPATTVLIYEGKNGQLDFRHDGRATVGFADGHAKLVGKEDAKNLVWAP